MKNIEKLESCKLNLMNLYSCYDYSGYSLQELLCQFFEAIKECIENSMEMKKLAEWLVNQGLMEEVEKQLRKWYEDGTLESIIDKSIFEKVQYYPILPSEVGVVYEKYPYGDVRRFGAIGDGEYDNSTAFTNALKSKGDPWSPNNHEIFIPAGTWKYTKEIKITKTHTKIRGEGMNLSILTPVNCNGIRLEYNSTNAWDILYGIVIEDLTISGGRTGIVSSYMGLNSKISNVYIENTTGTGLYATNCFDHVVEHLICRNCGSYGIYILQQEESETNPFRELSYITFNECMVINCNSSKTQWRLSGNNLYLNNCKANEGAVGVEFVGTTYACRVNNFYMDGTGPDSVMFKLNSTDLRNITFNNTYGWNVGTIIQAINCRSFEATNLDVNPEYWAYTAIKLEPSFNGTFQCDSKNYKIVDNRTDKKPFIYFGDFVEVPGRRILIKEVEIDMYAGGSEYTYEYSSITDVGLENIFVTPMSDLSYENRDNANKMEVPVIYSETNKAGYGYVKIKCNGTVNSTVRAKLQLMIIIKPSKAWQ